MNDKKISLWELVNKRIVLQTVAKVKVLNVKSNKMKNFL
jgi:hypothetical protein